MRGPRTATKSGPRWPQLEKARVQQRRLNAAKNKLILKKRDLAASALKKKKTLLNNQEITEEIKEEIKKYQGQMTTKTRQSKTYAMQQKQF